MVARPPTGGPPRRPDAAVGVRPRKPHDTTREDPMAESYSGEAYCVKCKEKREFTGDVHETNGRRMAKGKCPVCDTTVTRILGKKQ